MCGLSHVWLFVTPWTIYSLPGSSVHGVFQGGKWSGLLFSSPGIFLTQGLNPWHEHWQVDSLPQSQREAKRWGHQFSSVQSLSRVRLFVTPWIAARQASLSITNSQSSPKLMSIKLVMPSNHLILCHPLLLPPIPPSIRVFSNESTPCMRWPKYWSCSFSISPSY